MKIMKKKNNKTTFKKLTKESPKDSNMFEKINPRKGRYVCFDDHGSLIAQDNDLMLAMKTSKTKGCELPVIIPTSVLKNYRLELKRKAKDEQRNKVIQRTSKRISNCGSKKR
jgi:hypothetical protein